MALTSPQVTKLLAAGAPFLPLTHSSLQPTIDIHKTSLPAATILFPGAPHAQAALSGLLFRLGCWDESHTVAQEINAPEGSYWHAILHRTEPDDNNARHWFRRFDQHPIFPELLQQASDILTSQGPKHWQLKATWDPFQFIEWCSEARRGGGQMETTAIAIQMAEWQLLFDWCAGR